MERAGVFLYDADCGFCTKAGVWLSRMSGGAYDVQAWQQADLAALGLTARQCTDAAQFVTRTGEHYSGSSAIGEALRRGPRPLRPVGALIDAPGIRRLSAAVYRWVARNRYRLPGSTGQCRTS